MLTDPKDSMNSSGDVNESEQQPLEEPPPEVSSAHSEEPGLQQYESVAGIEASAIEETAQAHGLVQAASNISDESFVVRCNVQQTGLVDDGSVKVIEIETVVNEEEAQDDHQLQVASNFEESIEPPTATDPSLNLEESLYVRDVAVHIAASNSESDEDTHEEVSDGIQDGDNGGNEEYLDKHLQLASTMQMLFSEDGSALFSAMPRHFVFEIFRSVAVVVCCRDAANIETNSPAMELLECSSSGNILQRLEAWPECSQLLQLRANRTEFHGLFAAAMRELQSRAGGADRQPDAAEGEYELGQCDICCSETDCLLWRGGCCQASVCVSCLHRWLMDHLTEVSAKLGCPGCSAVLTVPQLRHLLSESAMDRRQQMLARQRGSNSNERDCPRCSCVARRPRGQRRLRSDRSQKELGGVVVKCAQCDYVWCFDCHSPAHPGLSCRRFRSGVHLLEDWAKQVEQSGLRKARRCPKCKAMIEKNDGCNHMTCAHCQHEFCYLCSKRWKVRQMRVPYLRWSVFGSHSSRLSVFGCRQTFLPERPALRRFVRGSLFALRTAGFIVCGAVVAALAVALLGIAIPFSPVLIPVIIVLARRGSLNCLIHFW